MSNPRRLFTLLLIFTCALRAASSLEYTQRAQSLLGPETWSQVIRIENEGRTQRYPRIVHALVFELAGILWFYTPSEGTQSFSLHRGELDREKNDFGPLLRDIEPGFVRWSVVSSAGNENVRVTSAPIPPLPNGCLIESVVALRERLARGAGIRDPRLLSYYIPTRAGLAGHTVLAYDTPQNLEIFDPAQQDRRLVFPRTLGPDALAVARALDGKQVAKARYIPLPLPESNAALATGVTLPAASAGKAAPSRWPSSKNHNDPA